MKLREFRIEDAPTILSWCKTREAFRRWSADRYKNFPAQPEEMASQYEGSNIYPLTAVDDEGKIVGHIMIRVPNPDRPSSVRLGFVIVDDSLRGRGLGKSLLRETIAYAAEHFSAEEITLGVFANNPPALKCYESVGFITTGNEEYEIDGEKWDCIEMRLQLTKSQNGK